MEERKELLSAINEFLDESVVLPPGDWDSKNLLSINEIQVSLLHDLDDDAECARMGASSTISGDASQTQEPHGGDRGR